MATLRNRVNQPFRVAEDARDRLFLQSYWLELVTSGPGPSVEPPTVQPRPSRRRSTARQESAVSRSPSLILINLDPCPLTHQIALSLPLQRLPIPRLSLAPTT